MKKNLFMVMVLSLVFLGLGNVSFAQNCDYEMCVDNANSEKALCNADPGFTATTCNNNYDLELSSCSKCTSHTSNPAIPGGSNAQTSAGASNDTNPTANSCESYADGRTTKPLNGDCPVGTTNDGFSNGNQVFDCCNSQSVGSTGSYCQNTPSSSLNNDPHAIVSIPGISCDCERGYGISTSKSPPELCQPCTNDDVCCGTKLNTKIPFIGNCIETTTQNPTSKINENTAFPVLITALVKILISVILIASFVLIVVAGVMIATGDAKGGKDMIVKVAIGLALLGASGVILRLINPNFFG